MPFDGIVRPMGSAVFKSPAGGGYRQLYPVARWHSRGCLPRPWTVAVGCCAAQVTNGCLGLAKSFGL